MLLASGWRNNIRSVGQKFEGGVVEFRIVLCKYAIEVGFEFTFEDVSGIYIAFFFMLVNREKFVCIWIVLQDNVSVVNCVL